MEPGNHLRYMAWGVAVAILALVGGSAVLLALGLPSIQASPGLAGVEFSMEAAQGSSQLQVARLQAATPTRLPPKPAFKGHGAPRVWQMPAWTALEAAAVQPGATYWRLIRASYVAGEIAAAFQFRIRVAAMGETGRALAGVPVTFTLGETETGPAMIHRTEGKRDHSLAAYGLEIAAQHETPAGSMPWPVEDPGGVYRIWIDGLPTDQVLGLGSLLNQGMTFLLIYQRTPG